MTKNNTSEKQNNIIVSDPAISGIDQTVSENNNTLPIPESKYNLKNLKPYNPNYKNTLTTEEAQKRGRLGAAKSAEVRRAKKTMKETLDAILSREISPEVLENNGIDIQALNGDHSALNVLLTQIVAEGIANRDFRAAAFIRDTIGEQPITKQEIKQEIITPEDLKTIDNLKSYLTG